MGGINTNMSYVLYAIDKHGEGLVQEIGRFEDLDEIKIHVGIFADDVLIEISKEDETIRNTKRE